jgi:hypothetical protein
MTLHDAAGVAGGGVDEDGIRTGGEQGLAAIHAVVADSDGSADAELAVGVLGGVGEHLALDDVLLGDEAGELASWHRRAGVSRCGGCRGS